MAAYYNEFDPFAAAWLRNLIAGGHIAPGDVDERSIIEVQPDDLRGYTQCHFFAGIGGWSYAFRLAGWDDARPVWSGSCPCQPFSAAGKKSKQSDERHLWPHWFRLIRECRPATIYGEQVASAIAAGWWDDVATDLEAENYACAAAVLPACSVGRPHRRDRLWFVADGNSKRLPQGKQATEAARYGHPAQSNGGVMGNAESLGRRQGYPLTGGGIGGNGAGEVTEPFKPGDSPMGNAKHDGWHGRPLSGSDASHVWQQEGAQGTHRTLEPEGTSQPKYVANPSLARLEGFAGDDCPAQGWQKPIRSTPEGDPLEWIACPDGKHRPVKPGLCLLAHGVPNRVGKLRGYGNAIVAQVAAAFIEASGVM